MTARALRCCGPRIIAVTVATAAFALLWPRLLAAQDEEGPPPRMVRVYGVVREPDSTPAEKRLIRFAPENDTKPRVVAYRVPARPGMTVLEPGPGMGFRGQVVQLAVSGLQPTLR